MWIVDTMRGRASRHTTFLEDCTDSCVSAYPSVGKRLATPAVLHGPDPMIEQKLDYFNVAFGSS